jgi:hypothetical protein
MSGIIALIYLGPPVCVGILVGCFILLIQHRYGVPFKLRVKIISSMVIISWFLLYLFEPTFYFHKDSKNINIFLLIVYLISNWLTLMILELISILIYLVKSIFKLRI